MNLFKEIKEFFYPCLNWSVDNKQCRLNYEYGHALVNKKDLKVDCQGRANSSLCCWYKNTNFSDKDIKKMRQKLR